MVVYFKFINVYSKYITNRKFYYLDKLKLQKNVLSCCIGSLGKKSPTTAIHSHGVRGHFTKCTYQYFGLEDLPPVTCGVDCSLALFKARSPTQIKELTIIMSMMMRARGKASLK